MSEKLYLSFREAPPVEHHLDGLDTRLKEKNSFINSLQNIKDIKKFYNHEAKRDKKKSKTNKIVKRLIHSSLLVIV